MGLVSTLFTLPIAPLRGVVAVADLLQRAAVEQLNDPASIRDELDRIAASRNAGLLDPQEADARENELIQRLIAARQRRPLRGGGEYG